VECKLKHLELCQNVVTRMAGNSFFLKGWAVTITSAIFAISSVEKIGHGIFIVIIPILIFWFLDSYYLRQERLYRKLYDAVRVKKEEEIDFSLNASVFNSDVQSLIRIMFSVSILPFYSSLLLVEMILSRFLQ